MHEPINDTWVTVGSGGGKIVLSFRGTKSRANVLTDLRAWGTQFVVHPDGGNTNTPWSTTKKRKKEKKKLSGADDNATDEVITDIEQGAREGIANAPTINVPDCCTDHDNDTRNAINNTHDSDTTASTTKHVSKNTKQSLLVLIRKSQYNNTKKMHDEMKRKTNAMSEGIYDGLKAAKSLLGHKVKVHAGFYKAWTTSNFNRQVVELVGKLLAENAVREEPPHIYITGHSVCLLFYSTFELSSFFLPLFSSLCIFFCIYSS